MDELKDLLERAEGIVEVAKELKEIERKLAGNLLLLKEGIDKKPEIRDLKIKAEVKSIELRGLKHGTKYLPEEDDWLILCLELLLAINSKVDQEE
jgi:CRISPR/Cas system CMR-associated protein Cmr1 (group 7 of RAMP superfamily)